MTGLAGQRALVTGASRGIGLAVARALAAEGAQVVLLARRREALEAAARAIGGGAVAIPCDLTVDAEVATALRAVERSIGTPDLLVNNAGTFVLGGIGTVAPADVARLLSLNVLAPHVLLHALVPAMRARGSGHVITIGSVSDRHALPGNAAYAAAKFGARAMHEVLREELRGSGVRLSLVSPGPVDTELWDPIHPELLEGFPARHEMLRPEAVADAVCWVATRARDVNVDELRLGRA